MSNVINILKLMPQDAETDLEEILDSVSLPEDTEVTDTNEETIAFGLSALLVSIQFNDEDIDPESIVEAISNADGVESVSVEKINKL